MKINNTLVSSVLVILLCLSLIAGGTFAIFTSESQVNIAISSGKVQVALTISEYRAYSIPSITAGIIENENADDYEERDADRTDLKTFKNGGTVSLDETKQQLVIERITPGDKVEVDILLENLSNVDALYRVNYTLAYEDELGNLQELPIANTELVISVGEEEYAGAQESNWSELVNGANETVTVEIRLPASATKQEINCIFLYSVEAVQGNTNTDAVPPFSFFPQEMLP